MLVTDKAEMTHETIPYDENKFRRGGIYATLLPITIGVSLGIMSVINWSTDSSFFILPIIFSFTFIAPIVALLSVRELRRRAPFTREEIFHIGFIKSSSANFYVAVIYNIVIVGMLLVISDGNRVDIMMILGGVFVFGGFIQFILWLVITVPITMFCTMIFEKTVIPK